MVRKRFFRLFFRIFPAVAFLVSTRLLLSGPIEKSVSSSFKKLSEAYTVSYGDPKAPIHITEYFSFSCRKCLEFIRRDFITIQSRYIDTGKVYWTFHPDPADLLTLQAMVCFETLQALEKQNLLSALAKQPRWHSIKRTCFKLQKKMNDLGKPLPHLHDLSYLEKTEAFRSAYAYLKQTGVPEEVPTIEINGTLYPEFPSIEWIDQILMDLPSIATKGRSK